MFYVIIENSCCVCVGMWVDWQCEHQSYICEFDAIRTRTLNNQCLWMDDKSHRICIEY